MKIMKKMLPALGLLSTVFIASSVYAGERARDCFSVGGQHPGDHTGGPMFAMDNKCDRDITVQVQYTRGGRDETSWFDIQSHDRTWGNGEYGRLLKADWGSSR